jgi:small subunit ribosomal protein S7
MPRKQRSVGREILPDMRCSSTLVTKFVNSIMHCGKKSVAEHIFYGSLDDIKQKMPDKDPVEVFKAAVENVKPKLEVKSRRVGGANYQVPVEVRPDRRTTLAVRWIIQSARSRPERTMREKLALELMDAFNNTGIAIKKKEDTHRMAEANKAFAHYRW